MRRKILLSITLFQGFTCPPVHWLVSENRESCGYSVSAPDVLRVAPGKIAMDCFRMLYENYKTTIIQGIVRMYHNSGNRDTEVNEAWFVCC